MGKSLTQKILEKHLIVGKYEPGNEIGIRIDQTLTHDATGTMAYLQLEAIGVDRVKTQHSVNFIDHNTLQIGFENADDHRYLQAITAKYGVDYSRAGNGICHQVHLERFGKPGTTLLGADSHTPTGGGIGQIAIGAGGLDVALAMAGAPFYLVCPNVIKIHLKGKLKPWVSAKDVILKVLGIFSTKGNVDCIFEYDGPGATMLSVPERATITNMGAECGVTTSVFPSDGQTRKFLLAQGREQDWVELKADPDAEYHKVVDLNLSEIEPMIAIPHSPGNVKKVKDVAGLAVDQVCVGSCTNSSLRDLMTVAKILKGRVVHPDVSFVLAPGSRQVLNMIATNGALAELIKAGVRLEESTCGFCIGNGQSPASAAVSLRTSNRNFKGRSGTVDAQVYLVSAETAAAAVITGKITDPRELGIKLPAIRMAKKFLLDDSMIIKPPEDRSSVRVVMGPNIVEIVKNEQMPEELKATVAIKVGDKITTDHIIPGGARMKYRSNVPEYSKYLFETIDPTFYERAKKIKEGNLSNVIVGGISYGQGSSREHAALCPMFMGVKAIIAKSFERIHTDNLINFGIPPLIFKNESDYDKIAQGDQLEIPGMKNLIMKGEPLKVKDVTENFEFEVTYKLSERQKVIVLAGGALNLVTEKGQSGSTV
jgi:aconitate hydratase